MRISFLSSVFIERVTTSAEGLQTRIFTQSKNPPGFSYSEQVKKYVWSDFWSLEFEVRLGLILLSKHQILRIARVTTSAEGLQTRIYGRSKNPPGFSHFKLIKKSLRSDIWGLGLDVRLSSILLSKDFGNIRFSKDG